MKTQTETGAKASIKDFRREVAGKKNADFGKEIEVSYDYTYDILETDEELHRKFSAEDLLKLANGRLKATANSAARQKATADYALSGDDAAREEMIKAAMKLRKNLTREQAESYVDSLATL
jgi:hypothetical protein